MSKPLRRASGSFIFCFAIVCTLLLSFPFTSHAQGSPLEDMKIDMGYGGPDLMILIKGLEQVTSFSFAYSPLEMTSRKIDIRTGQWNLLELLETVSVQARVSFRRVNGTITIKPAKDKTSLPDVTDIVMGQVIRGTVLDEDAHFPLPGATVIMLNTDPMVGTVTGENGNFRFEKVPLGRVDIKVSYIGYEDKIIPNVIVNSGKQVVLNITLQEAFIELGEVSVQYQKTKGEVNNEMSLVSGRSVSVEETHRFAGSFRDPARMVTALAGVTNQPEGEGYNNDIVVRGNSPKYIQWRLEGIEIPNPSHFSKLDASGGAISALNSDLLDDSDFYMGAFAPEYGDVLSGVFDVRLRRGNNKKREHAVGVGALGADATIEGPFKKDYGGSYLVNYRYSTVAMLTGIGFVNKVGVPRYQDAAYKICLPTKKAGTFSLFGLGGLSETIDRNYFIDSRAIAENLYMHTNVESRFNMGSGFMTSGINHIYPLSKNSFLESSVNYSANMVFTEEFPSKRGKLYDFSRNYLRDTVSSEINTIDARMTRAAWRGALKFTSKINARHKIEAGTKYTLVSHRYKRVLYREQERDWYPDIDFDKSIGNIRSFLSWKFRLNENLTIVSGFHHFHVFLNNENSFEPRVAARWQFPNGSALSAGFGMHSTMETVSNYFSKVEDENGNITEPNRDLSLLKALHYVIGYEKRLGENTKARIEAYYQYLYDLPVANNDTSYYATINEINDFRNIDLVNEGTCRNYGAELTVERFFSDHYYFMFTTSLYRSRYTSLEGRERNTRYDGKYSFHFLCGKEFVNIGARKNKDFALNTRIIFLGAKPYVPLRKNEAGQIDIDWDNYVFYDYDNAYESRLDNIFQINFSASYKINRPKATHEISLDIINLNNNAARVEEYYDAGAPNGIGYDYSLSIIPNLIYRVHF